MIVSQITYVVLPSVYNMVLKEFHVGFRQKYEALIDYIRKDKNKKDLF